MVNARLLIGYHYFFPFFEYNTFVRFFISLYVENRVIFTILTERFSSDGFCPF